MPYGWRGLYALALLPLALIIPLRRVLPESQRFEREKLEGVRPSNVLQPLVSLECDRCEHITTHVLIQRSYATCTELRCDP